MSIEPYCRICHLDVVIVVIIILNRCKHLIRLEIMLIMLIRKVIKVKQTSTGNFSPSWILLDIIHKKSGTVNWTI